MNFLIELKHVTTLPCEMLVLKFFTDCSLSYGRSCMQL